MPAMGKVKDLDVIYEKSPVFAGHILKGRLVFNVSKEPTYCKHIFVSFKGLSKTSLNGDTSASKSSEHCYFNLKLPLTAYLMQYRHFDGKYLVPNGQHSIPFSFPVPPGAPSTFGGKYGYVHYGCKATVVSCGAKDMVKEKGVGVVGMEDLNMHPYAAVTQNFEESYCQRILCFEMANVRAVLSIPKSGYLPGEDVLVTGEVVNDGKKQKVNKVCTQLTQTAQFTHGSKSKETTAVVAEISHGEINPCSVQKFEEERLKIPPSLAPSFLRGCKNISLTYELLFTVDPGIRIAVPLVIGTIPFSPDKFKEPPKALPWKTMDFKTAAGPPLFFPRHPFVPNFPHPPCFPAPRFIRIPPPPMSFMYRNFRQTGPTQPFVSIPASDTESELRCDSQISKRRDDETDKPHVLKIEEIE